MNELNGTTQNISGRRKNGECKDERERLGEYGEDSPVDGINSLGIVEIDSAREDSTRHGSCEGCASNGKILERLELIEKRFLTHLQENRQQFEARLQESETIEAVFVQEVQALKQQIYFLTIKPQE
ncbi:MAG: hypothetical protein HEQ19_13905 [Gloeotrichia echinulata CP02]|nr:hypothetical protein [Gloeotrichia echinulata DEX184]